MKMRLCLFLAILLNLVWAALVMAQYGQDQNVRGYSRQDGTYVQPYHRTAPDRDPLNNYSTRGNVNPWTGERGTVDPYKQPAQPLDNPYGTQRRRTWP